jgi:hypothetical protein
MLRGKLMGLLLAGALLAATVPAGTVTAGNSTTPNDQADDCKRVDAYRITTCAEALLPASPLGRQLAWVLGQLAGLAATLTEAEVQAHYSAAFFAVWREKWSPTALVAAFQQTITERGTFSFVGFAYPPRPNQALALVQSSTGERGAIEIGVTAGHPAHRVLPGRALVARGDFADYFTDDVSWTTVGGGQERHGRGPVRDFLIWMHTQALNADPKIKTLVVGDGQAVLEADCVGTHIGEFLEEPASGRSVQVPYCVVYDLQQEKMAALRAYISMDLFAQHTQPNPE